MSDTITNTTNTNESKVFNVYVSKSTTAGTVLVTRGSLNKTDTAPTVAGLYILSDVGTYTNLVPIIHFGENEPSNVPITTEEVYANYVYYDGAIFTQVKTKMPEAEFDFENLNLPSSVTIGSEINPFTNYSSDNSGYLFNKRPFLKSGLISEINIHCDSTGTLNVVVFSKIGEIYNIVQRHNLNIEHLKWNKINCEIPVKNGEFIGFYNNILLGKRNSDSDSSIGFIEMPKNNNSAQSLFTDANVELAYSCIIDEKNEIIDTLQGTFENFPYADNNSYVINENAIKEDGILKGVIIPFDGVGKTKIAVFSSLDNKYKVEYVKEIDVVVGYNTIDLDFQVKKNHKIAVYNSVPMRSGDYNDVANWRSVNTSYNTAVGDIITSAIFNYSKVLLMRIFVEKAHDKILTTKDISEETKRDNTWLQSSPVNLPPDGIFNFENATKLGSVLKPSSITSDFDGGIVESPNIFYDEKLKKYVMVYTAYTSVEPIESSIGWATSDDLLNWEKKGKLFGKSGIIGTGDRFGTTGPAIIYYQEKYHLFYIGLASEGYEGRPCTIMHATNDSLSDVGWERHGYAINVQPDIDWANFLIYHPFFMRKDNKWYCFFNAKGTVNGFEAERTGFATNDSLYGEWTVDPERISKFSEDLTGNIDIQMGDPAIIEHDGLYYMFYFHMKDKIVDHWAWTTKLDFPRGWRYGGEAIVRGVFDNYMAHKPFLIKKDNKLYHFYTAVNYDGDRRIALQTFDL